MRYGIIVSSSTLHTSKYFKKFYVLGNWEDLEEIYNWTEDSTLNLPDHTSYKFLKILEIVKTNDCPVTVLV